MIGRVVGVDFGTRRIGVAIGDLERRIASPLTTIEASRDHRISAQRLVEATLEHEIAQWVVGLPLNMDGTEGPQAKLHRAFAEVLGSVTGRPVHLWDERLSTHGANEYLSMSGLSRQKRKKRRDRVAASIILQSFLDSRVFEE